VCSSDLETAEVAVQAAMTGHLVFSTMHTNDALGTIPRLLDLGIPDYLVGATLDGVIAQRLVRRICSSCTERYEPSSESVALLMRDDSPALGRRTLRRGKGCSDCRGTGYRGRTGLFELLTVTDPLRDAIASRATRAQLQAVAVREGMRSMRDDGWAKVQAGLTTVEEVLRVVTD